MERSIRDASERAPHCKLATVQAKATHVKQIALSLGALPSEANNNNGPSAVHDRSCGPYLLRAGADNRVNPGIARCGSPFRSAPSGAATASVPCLQNGKLAEAHRQVWR
jgi:hypothetical protein